MFNLFQKPRRARKPDETGVAIVAMIGNECDIIELFIRHNAPFCDKFYIVLHNSFDATAQIIEKMRAEGFDIDVRVNTQIEFEQGKITTALANQAARTGRYDYIIPLDTDEFLPYDKGHSVLDTIRAVPAKGWGIMHWKTFVPPDSDYFASANPLLSFRARSFEPNPTNKVILGGDYAKHCSLAAGNHRPRRGLRPRHPDPVIVDIALGHFPFRSPAQVLRKAMLSRYSFAFVRRRKLRGSYSDLLDKVRAKNYQLDYDFILDDMLKPSGIAEAAQKGAPVVDKKAVPALDKRVKIAYGDLMQINLIADMDGFIRKWITVQ